MLFFKGNISKHIIYSTLFIFLMADIYFVIYHPTLSKILTNFISIFATLVYSFVATLAISRNKNRKYKDYQNNYNNFVNRILLFFFIPTFIYSFLPQGYITSIILANIFLFIYFLFNKMYQPLGDNADTDNSATGSDS